MIFRQIHAFVAYGRCAPVNLHKGQRIEQANDLASEHAFRVLYVHEPARRAVDLLYLHAFVEHQNGVGRVGNDFVRKGFRFFLQIRQAHAEVSLPEDHGFRFFAAGVVAAASAVELILGFCFAQFAKHLLNRRAADMHAAGRERGKFLIQLLLRRIEHIKVLLAGGMVHREKFLHGRAAVFAHNRPAHTATRARGHLDETFVKLVVQNVLYGLDAVFDTVHAHIGITGAVSSHGAEYPSRRREEARLAVLIVVGKRFEYDMRFVEPF